ncbi:MAG: hypothetical protein WDM79_14845 [Terricaulis sp.]
MSQLEIEKRSGQKRSGATLLGPIPQSFISPLIAFAEYIAALEVDFLIFQARKAIRLHDLLLAAGCRVPRATMISDHALDQDLSMLNGKRVAIVDDTLILGTTIADTERKLRNAGASTIQKVVFAIDHENWCREIAQVDKYFVSLSAHEMLNFCASEVAALALAGIPYLTDFPITKQTRIPRSKLSALFSRPGWDSFSLTSATQESAEVFFYTHLPVHDGPSPLAVIGDFASLVEIAKIRSFVFTTSTAHMARIVPIVTLKPLSERRVLELFNSLLDQLPLLGANHRDRLQRHLSTPRSQVRLIQYFLGLMIGENFLAPLSEELGASRPILFDLKEATRLFGPWLGGELDELHAVAAEMARNDRNALKCVTTIDALPAEIQAIADADYALLRSARNPVEAENGPRNAFSDLIRVFVELHKRHELPARAEARKYGAAIFDQGSDNAPHRDRLKIGYSWSDLAAFLGWRDKLKVRPARSMRLSLMLDVLVDVGIAVPILCLRNGILFRAYRHGEDAPFAEQEHALVHRLATGFLEGNGRADIPRLTMEKLLVALLQVGTAQGFIERVLGLHGASRVARIAFHRHGAVATFTDEATVYAGSQESWLSRHLVGAGVLKRTEKGYYELGASPDAAFVRPDAPLRAQQLGHLLGMLSRRPGTDAPPPPLDENDLTVLTTCAQPKDAAGAVLTELRIFNNWLQDNYAQPRQRDFASETTLQTAHSEFTQSGGYAAVNSARFKLENYWSDRAEAVTQRCAEHLRNLPDTGAFLADHWLGIWASVEIGGNADQRAKFDPIIDRLANEIVSAAVGVFTMELAVTSQLALLSVENKRRHQRACQKVAAWLTSISRWHALPAFREKAFQRLMQITESKVPMENPPEVFQFGIDHTFRRQAIAQRLTMDATDEVRNYGRLQRRTDFAFALWYDIIDSTGRKSALSGTDLKTYLAQVADFKSSVAQVLRGVQRDARRAGVEIQILPNDLKSTDDEKHILFARKNASLWHREAIRALLVLGESKGVNMRLLAINADFAGVAPHCYHGDPTIEGTAFWEVGSTLRTHVKKIEANFLKNGMLKPSHSHLWFGDALANEAASCDFLSWVDGVSDAHATASMNDRTFRTRLRGGLVKP